MPHEINAIGLQCPQPVILAKKGIEVNDYIVVIVDNDTAVENLKRLGSGLGCDMKIDSRENSTFVIHMKKRFPHAGDSGNATPAAKDKSTGFDGIKETIAIVFSGDTMGRGDDELGRLLAKAFIHTLIEAEKKPDILIFYNSGVNLTVSGSDAVEDLRVLEKKGTEILICGTCADFYDIKGKIGAGHISNMYDIVNSLTGASKIINP